MLNNSLLEDFEFFSPFMLKDSRVEVENFQIQNQIEILKN